MDENTVHENDREWALKTNDMTATEATLKDLQKRADLFGRSMTNAFKASAISGHAFGDVLKQLSMNLSSMALNAGLKPLQDKMSGLFKSFIGSLLPEKQPPAAQGPVKAYAKGGIVSSPTYFSAGGALGLMGEAGAEAVMPLTRGADGRLGVAAQGGGAPVHVTFNVTTSDVASFRRSEAQVTGMLARAVRRGARTL